MNAKVQVIEGKTNKNRIQWNDGRRLKSDRVIPLSDARQGQ